MHYNAIQCKLCLSFSSNAINVMVVHETITQRTSVNCTCSLVDITLTWYKFTPSPTHYNVKNAYTHTCTHPLGKWSNMWCRLSARSGLFGRASITAISACAVESSFGTVMLAFLSPLGAGETDREMLLSLRPSSCNWLEVLLGGTLSELGLLGTSEIVVGLVNSGLTGRLFLLLQSMEDPDSVSPLSG